MALPFYQKMLVPGVRRGGEDLKVIAAKLGISRARVWQLEVRALRKLRKAIEEEAAAAGVTVREWLFGA
jgi:DNA-directed RNA polymerase specialized sigma24 family protein